MSRINSLLLVSLSFSLTAADWRQFRGNDSTGIAADSLPTEFGTDRHIAWKSELPGRGPSSPIVVGNHVFVTASTGTNNDRLLVLALDAASGAKRWQRTFWATGPTDCHPKSSMAAPTPASDGKSVLALFGSDDLICLDLEGNLLWIRSLHEENPGATDGRGLATSPVIVDGVAVVQIENQNNSFATGIDMQTGKSLWRIERPRQYCWTSPIALPDQAGRPTVLLQGSSRLSAVDVHTGKEIWTIDRSSDAIASSLVQGNMLYVPGKAGLVAYELSDNARAPRMLWEKNKLSPGTASPLAMGDSIYALRGSILSRGEPKTGEMMSQCRLKGSFSASVVGAGGALYCVNEAGTIQVIKPGAKEDTVIASADLGDTVLATPAVANGGLYIRGEKYLWKIAKKG